MTMGTMVLSLYLLIYTVLYIALLPDFDPGLMGSADSNNLGCTILTYNTLHLPSSNSQPQLLYQQSLLVSLASVFIWNLYNSANIYVLCSCNECGGLGGPHFVLCLFYALGVELYSSGAKKKK